jgi:hypothetical protein
MTRERDSDPQPRWQKEQMEIDDAGEGRDRRPTDEVDGGLRGGGGPDWNKGSMEWDDQERSPESSQRESEQGPWGSAEAADRARRDKPTEDR